MAAQPPAGGPSRAPAILALLVLIGALAFGGGLFAGGGARVWAVFLVNLLFWSGLAASGPAIAGMFELTEAKWAARLRRIATTTVAFMPVSFGLFLVLMAGLSSLYPWVMTPLPAKAAWLNVPFFVLRTLVGVAVLYWVSIRFARAVHASPAGAAEEPGRARRARLAVVMLFLYVIVGSLLGYDLIMSLEPHWFSGLLGGYFVVGMLYSSFAFLVILVGAWSAGRPGWVLPPQEMQDLAKLVFTTSIVWMYFFWSQYLVIWYGNVPVETRYVLARFFADPWRRLAIMAFLVGWLLPFCYFLGRLTGRPPQSHRVLTAVAGLAMLAMFVERIVLVFPAVTARLSWRLALLTVLVTVGFGALFVLTFRLCPSRMGLVAGGES